MKNLYEMIENAGQLYGDRIFLDCPGQDGRQEISYIEFNEEVLKQAQTLTSLGVKAGDRVSFLTPKILYGAKME